MTSAIGTLRKVKQVVQSVVGECLFGADDEFFVDAALTFPDAVNLADR